MPLLTVAGYIGCPAFHEARLVAEDVVAEDPLLKLKVVGLIESEWQIYLKRVQQQLTGKVCEHTEDVLVLNSALGYIGGVDELITWAHKEYKIGDPRSDKKTYKALQEEFIKIASNQVAKYIHDRKGTSKFAYFDFSFDPSGDSSSSSSSSTSSAYSSKGFSSPTSPSSSSTSSAKGGRSDSNRVVVVELYEDRCPKTVENFLALCTGSHGISRTGVALHYLNSPVHRVTRDAWVQLGDIVSGKGNAGESIFGPTFADESMVIPHDGPGILAMASAGTPHSNNSQFYVTLRELPYLDGRRVVFGRVILGMNVIYQINQVATTNERPNTPVLISDCGVFAPEYDPEFAAQEEEKAAASAAAHHIARRGVHTNSNKKRAGKELTIGVFGLDGAGKTSIVNALKGDLDDAVLPTSGFEVDLFSAHGATLRVYCLGGKKSLRGIWPRYYADCHAFIYVVDGSDKNRLAEATSEFQQLVQHAYVAKKPVLVLLNKTDKAGSASMVSTSELDSQFRAQSFTNVRIRSCSAALVSNSKTGEVSYPASQAAELSSAIKWLVEAAEKDYAVLSKRIVEEKAEHQVKAKQEAERKRLAANGGDGAGNK